MFSFVRDQATVASACVWRMYFPVAWNTLPNMGGQVPRTEPGRLFDTLFTPPFRGPVGGEHRHATSHGLEHSSLDKAWD